MSQGLGQNMELAHRVKVGNEGLQLAQFNLGPNMNFNSHAIPCQMIYNHSPKSMVVQNATVVTLLPPTLMEKGPPQINRLKETPVSVKSMVKAFKKGGQSMTLELESLAVQIEETVTESLSFIAHVLQQNRSALKWPKELAWATPKPTLTSEIPTKSDYVGINTENRTCHEELWKSKNRSHELEVSGLKGEDPNG